MKRIVLSFLSLAIVALAGTAMAEDRATIVNNAIIEHNEDLKPEDRAEKYDKMATSPFVFYRGTNHLYWMDFAGDDRLDIFSNKKTKTWIQGDLHVYNFGAFDNDKKEVVYNVNDFDESFVGDYTYDVLRLAVSLVLIGRLNKDGGGERYVSDEHLKEVVDSFTESYLVTLAKYVGNDNETKRYFTADNTGGKLDDFLKKEGQTDPAKARKKMLGKWTSLDANGKPIFANSEQADKGKLSETLPSEDTSIRAAMKAYGATLSGRLVYNDDYFAVQDVARRLRAGTGSLGIPRFYILIAGQDPDSQKDDRILDVKKQTAPTAFDQLGPDEFTNPARRHAQAYLALTKHTDDHLGWMHLKNVGEDVAGDYSIRERSPYKESFPVWLDPDEKRKPDFEPRTKKRYRKLAEQWGQILATSHARADDDFDEELVPFSLEEQVTAATKNHVEDFQEFVRDIAFSYATQVNEDWENWKLADR